MVQMTNFVMMRRGGRPDDFKGFTGFGNKKPVNQPAASQPQRPAGTTGPGSGYTPGGDSFKNYSQQDQQKMFQQAGGEKQFKENVAEIEQKYKRSADIQRYLDRTNLFNQFKNKGDGIVKDAQGRTILSMQDPYLTAQAPTFGQLMGDIGRGIGSIVQGFAEKGPPVVQFLNALRTGVMDFISPAQNEMVGMERQVGFGSQELDDFNSLNKSQQNTYLMLKKSGATHMEALNQAKLQTMAMGGVVSLR